MSTLKLKFENISPLIHYAPAGAWVPGNPADDPEFNKYSDSDFTLTTSVGAGATINFNGTHITIYGAKRGNHNLYNVTLDNAPPVSNSGQSGTDQFQVPLFDSGDLPDGPHTVTISDASTSAQADQSYLDIDFVNITSIVGTQQIVVEDDESPFIYLPATSAWNTSPPNVSDFSSGNGHSTSTNGANVTLNFVGDSIDIFGLVGASAGGYTVSVDGAAALSYSASNNIERTQQVLFSGRQLGDTAHTIVLTNVGVSGSTLNIDFAQLYGSSPRALQPGTQFADAASPPSGTSSAASAIIGVLAALLIIAIGVIGILLFMLKRRAQMHRRHSGFSIDPHEPHPRPQLEPYMHQAAPSLTLPSAYSSSIPPPIQNRYMSSMPDESVDVAESIVSPGRQEAPPLPPKSSLVQGSTRLPYLASRAEDFGPVEMLPPDYGQATRR